MLFKALALFEVVSCGFVLWLIASGQQVSPPIIASRPLLIGLLLFQVLGVFAGTTLLVSLRLGVRLSLVFQGLQLMRLRTPTMYLALQSALSFPLSYSITPGTVKELTGPRGAEILSHGWTLSIDLLSLVVFGYLLWGLKASRMQQPDCESAGAA